MCSVIFIDNILLMAQSQEELTQITRVSPVPIHVRVYDQLGEVSPEDHLSRLHSGHPNDGRKRSCRVM